MRQPELHVELCSPSGVTLDVSSRVDRSGLTAISEQVGEEVLEIVHSDMDLVLWDLDGAVEAFFADAEPDDEYTLRVERETQQRRPKWQRIFYGVLEVPWSLRFNRKRKTVALQAFSFSKLLERGSAEGLSRAVSDWTVTGTAGTSTLTASASVWTYIVPGDQITITDGDLTDTRTVLWALNTTIELTENLTNSYSGAPLTLDTPWPRHYEVHRLSLALFQQAGIDDLLFEPEKMGDVPFLQGYSGQYLQRATADEFYHLIPIPASEDPYGYDQPSLSVVGGATDREHVSYYPSYGFASDGTTGATHYADWTPYLTSKPAALESPDSGGADKDIQRWDQVTSAGYDMNSGYDHAGGERWGMRENSQDLLLYKSGVLEATIHSSIAAKEYYGALDFVPTADWGYSQDVVVCSYVDNVSNINRIKCYDIDGTSMNTVSLTQGGGGVRCIVDREAVAVQDWTSDYGSGPQAGTIRFFEGSDSGDKLVAISGKYTPYREPPMLMWTMRSIGDYIACLYQYGSTTRCRVWLWSDLSQAADFQVSSSTSTDTYMTKWQVHDRPAVARGGRGALRDVLVGMVGADIFLISNYFVGTIPYVDCEGKSCSELLRELAVMTASVFDVDHFRVGRFRTRGTRVVDEPSVELDTPLERESVPVWEYYKTSITVQGDNVEVIRGSSGDSARRLEVSSDLITTDVLANAVGDAYVSFFGALRSQESVSVEEKGTILATFDRVSLDGQDYMVLEPETDLDRREQQLQLVSV